MGLSKEAKIEIFKKYGASEVDTGSTVCQIALLTEQIKSITEHIKINKKDNGTKRSLQRKVSQRKSFLAYLKENDLNKYREIVKELKLRV
jgi:small subunit ribosomal protein S15